MNNLIDLVELVKLLEHLESEEARLEKLVELGNNLLTDVTDLCIVQKYKRTIEEVISFAGEHKWLKVEGD